MAGHQRTADTPAGGGRADTPPGGGGARYYGWAYMLTLWGKGGYGGSPNVEAGKGVSTNKAVGFDQRPRPLHDRYTRTDTCVRWGMSVKYIAVNFLPFHFRNRRVTAVSILKPPVGGFRIETVHRIQKWFKISVGTSRKLYL
jgi:hypothetical protein